jgi:hypothetical protein
MKKMIEIGYEGLDVYVDGRLVLHISQVSDDTTINLFLYPEGDLIESIMHQENPTSKCTHEIILERKL